MRKSRPFCGIGNTPEEREKALRSLAKGKCKPMDLSNHLTSWRALRRVWDTDKRRSDWLRNAGYGVDSPHNVFEKITKQKKRASPHDFSERTFSEDNGGEGKMPVLIDEWRAVFMG